VGCLSGGKEGLALVAEVASLLCPRAVASCSGDLCRQLTVWAADVPLWVQQALQLVRTPQLEQRPRPNPRLAPVRDILFQRYSPLLCC